MSAKAPTWERWNGERIVLREIRSEPWPDPASIEGATLVHEHGWGMASYTAKYGVFFMYGVGGGAAAVAFPTLDVSMSRLTSPVSSAQTEGLTQEVSS